MPSLTSAIAAAQPPAQKRPDCAAAEHRQFDFWLGAWDVTEKGKSAGTNRIESDLNGSVRQLWESSRDGGTTWTTAFDGRYVKKK